MTCGLYLRLLITFAGCCKNSVLGDRLFLLQKRAGCSSSSGCSRAASPAYFVHFYFLQHWRLQSHVEDQLLHGEFNWSASCQAHLIYLSTFLYSHSHTTLFSRPNQVLLIFTLIHIDWSYVFDSYILVVSWFLSPCCRRRQSFERRPGVVERSTPLVRAMWSHCCK